MKDDEAALTERVVELACEYGRYGYRRITAMLLAGRVEGEPQAGGAYLEEGRRESATEATQAEASMIE